MLLFYVFPYPELIRIHLHSNIFPYIKETRRVLQSVLICVVMKISCVNAFYGGKKLGKTDETYGTIIYGQSISIFQI